MLAVKTEIAPVSKPEYTEYFVEKTRRFFRHQAPDWEHEIGCIVQAVHEFRTGRRVLEIGCGVGTVLFALQREGLECHGVDFDPLQVDTGRILAREFGLDVSFAVARNEDVPFDRERFDVVVSRDVAEHLPDVELRTYLHQAYRFVKPGGVLVLHTKPAKYSYLHERPYVVLLLPVAYLGRGLFKRWLRALDAVVPRVYRAVRRRPMPNTWQQQPPGHCNCQEKESLEATIAEAGFTVLSTRLLVAANRRYFRLLERLMPFETTKTNILVVARKPTAVASQGTV
jgi:2-polyprenyl-3-methyl-5-hydroxy-6-metoxy-1,4-benzoquinol methylase